MPNKPFNLSLLNNLFINTQSNDLGDYHVKSEESRSRKEEKVLLLWEEGEKSQRSQEAVMPWRNFGIHLSS